MSMKVLLRLLASAFVQLQPRLSELRPSIQKVFQRDCFRDHCRKISDSPDAISSTTPTTSNPIE